MGRVIKLEETGKQRTLLVRSVVLALRELAHQKEINDLSKDLSAYIVLSLKAINDTIDSSVEAWEKRGYWLKADKFRLEWSWAEKWGQTMHHALLKDDWQVVATSVAQVAQKLKDVDVPKRHRIGTPWIGAWNQLMKSRL